MTREFDLIVVGGGAAGIGVARRLVAHGASCLLLEASSRLGGRAYTQDLGGYPLDLGCEWLHSGDRNAWVDVAEASGFPVDRGDPPWAKAHPSLAEDKDDKEAAWMAYGAWEERLGTIGNSVFGRRVAHQAAMARVKRSPKMTANWALAMTHSRGPIFHAFSERFKTR